MSRIRNRLMITRIKAPSPTAHPGSQDFSLSTELFLRDRRIMEIRPSTIRWYTKHLKYFRDYLVKRSLPTAPAEITLEMVEDFILYQRDERGNRPESINGKIRTLKVFFAFLKKKGILEVNPLTGLRQVRHIRHIVPTFTEDQVRDLLRQPDLSTFTGFRNYTIMCLMLDTGVRIGELLAVNLQDVVVELGVPQEIKIRQPKNRKERLLPLSPPTQGVLKKYLEVRQKAVVRSIPYLFPNLDCQKIGVRTIQESIHQYGQRAGIENVRVSPHTFRHTFRHTFAKMWVMAEGDILSLQEMLGHSSVEMVKNYARLFQTDIKKKHALYSPVATMGSLRQYSV